MFLIKSFINKIEMKKGVKKRELKNSFFFFGTLRDYREVMLITYNKKLIIFLDFCILGYTCQQTVNIRYKINKDI